MNATVTGWSQLPPDIIRVIVGYLSGSDLGAARLVNKQWAVEGARATRRICLRLKEHQDVAGVASITRALKKAAAGAMPSVKDQLLTAWHVFPEARHVSLRLPHCWDNQGVTGRVRGVGYCLLGHVVPLLRSYRVTALDIRGHLRAVDWPAVREVTELESLALQEDGLCELALKDLYSLTQLRSLTLVNIYLGNNDLGPLCGHLTSLTSLAVNLGGDQPLFLKSSPALQCVMSPLRNLKGLRELTIWSFVATSAGQAKVASALVKELTSISRLAFMDDNLLDVGHVWEGTDGGGRLGSSHYTAVCTLSVADMCVPDKSPGDVKDPVRGLGTSEGRQLHCCGPLLEKVSASVVLPLGHDFQRHLEVIGKDVLQRLTLRAMVTDTRLMLQLSSLINLVALRLELSIFSKERNSEMFSLHRLLHLTNLTRLEVLHGEVTTEKLKLDSQLLQDLGHHLKSLQHFSFCGHISLRPRPGARGRRAHASLGLEKLTGLTSLHLEHQGSHGPHPLHWFRLPSSLTSLTLKNFYLLPLSDEQSSTAAAPHAGGGHSTVFDEQEVKPCGPLHIKDGSHGGRGLHETGQGVGSSLGSPQTLPGTSSGCGDHPHKVCTSAQVVRRPLLNPMFLRAAAASGNLTVAPVPRGEETKQTSGKPSSRVFSQESNCVRTPFAMNLPTSAGLAGLKRLTLMECTTVDLEICKPSSSLETLICAGRCWERLRLYEMTWPRWRCLCTLVLADASQGEDINDDELKMMIRAVPYLRHLALLLPQWGVSPQGLSFVGSLRSLAHLSLCPSKYVSMDQMCRLLVPALTSLYSLDMLTIHVSTSYVSLADDQRQKSAARVEPNAEAKATTSWHLPGRFCSRPGEALVLQLQRELQRRLWSTRVEVVSSSTFEEVVQHVCGAYCEIR